MLLKSHTDKYGFVVSTQDHSDSFGEGQSHHTDPIKVFAQFLKVAQ